VAASEKLWHKRSRKEIVGDPLLNLHPARPLTMTSDGRFFEVERTTRETSIRLKFTLDGTGRTDITSGIPFLDHMLTLFAVHGFFDLEIQATGDHMDDRMDCHHAAEDLGICLGKALEGALGDRKGVRRYGEASVPMDETLAHVALDLSRRPFLVYHTPKLIERLGRFETELVPEFLRAFCQHGGVTLHVGVPYGENSHHILEAVFKAFGRALDQAAAPDPRRAGVPSSKGSL
jgi:imidazoleglycerol-phosphate dehydratase